AGDCCSFRAKSADCKFGGGSSNCFLVVATAYTSEGGSLEGRFEFAWLWWRLCNSQVTIVEKRVAGTVNNRICKDEWPFSSERNRMDRDRVQYSCRRERHEISILDKLF